ncbi:MAG: metallophosphoesterase [Actinomycetota bacterium]|nr:metallophosphoesterase [Actinomycetota bacterium]
MFRGRRPHSLSATATAALGVVIAGIVAGGAHAAAPANDPFAAAQVVSGAGGSVTGSNVAATKESGEPSHGGNAGGASVWYRWTAPSSGTLTVDTIGSSFDTLLAVYSGSAVNALTRLASNDDYNGASTSRVTLTVTSGATYQIAVDGWGGATGTAKLGWSATSTPTVPSNDAFAAATPVSGHHGTISGSNFGGTKEAGEPIHAGNAGGASVWYRWTAPATGTVSFDTLGSTFDTLLGVYTGGAVGGLTRVTSSDDWAGSSRSRVSFAATAGTEYRIAVDGWGGTTGTGRLNWNLLLPGDVAALTVGDIASCTSTGDEATAQLVDAQPEASLLTLGDHAYESGTTAEFTNCYDPLWGKFKPRTHPTTGNHEYMTPGAAGYFGYWGATAGDPATGTYSYDLGSWHVIVLNGNCAAVGGCQAGSTQEQWLRLDLTAHPAACTLAYWHQPRFTSGEHGSDASYQAFWDALYAANVDLVLNSHDHDYERFAPQSPTGAADPARGIREFLVGTGGRSHGGFPFAAGNSEVRNGDSYGVLRLTLRAGSYDWAFQPVAGATFTDSGATACH